MNELAGMPYVVEKPLKEKWNSLTIPERTALFAKVLRETTDPRLGEVFIEMQSEKNATAPLEDCYFVSDPDFQEKLCEAVRAYEGK